MELYRWEFDMEEIPAFMSHNKMQQILTFHFLEVVRQHILGVVDNVIHHHHHHHHYQQTFLEWSK